MANIGWAKKEPIDKVIALWNGSGTINIPNNPKSFETLPHGSPVIATSTTNTFTLIKGFESYETATSATQKVKKEHLLGLTDAFNIGGAVTVSSIDRTSSELYDTVVFSGSVATVAGTKYSQAITDGKLSLTYGECNIDNEVSSNQCRTGVLAEGIVDSSKTVLPLVAVAADYIKGITDKNLIFA